MTYDPASLPEVIRQYLQAHSPDAQGDRDTAALAATFSGEAAVVDEGHTYRGTDEINDWLSKGTSEFRWTSTPIDQSQVDASTFIVVNHLVGDFPGGEVDLDFRFTVHNGQIDELVMTPL